MTNRLALLTVFLGLCGCVPAMQQARTNEVFAKIDQEENVSCMVGPLTRENVVARNQCLDGIRIRELRNAGYAYMPLLYQMAAANQRVAVEFAEGRISAAQYDAMLDQNAANFSSNEQAARMGDAMLAQRAPPPQMPPQSDMPVSSPPHHLQDHLQNLLPPPSEMHTHCQKAIGLNIVDCTSTQQ
jgi:hypothetical protein